ncbi:MAG: ATP-binding protein [Candidatus Binatia bacterium]
MRRSVLVLGGGNDALDRIFGELGLDVERDATSDAKAGADPAIVALFRGAGGEEPLREVARRYPSAEVVLVFPAEDSEHGQAAARALGVDAIFVPPDHRRTTEIVQHALDRQERKRRHRDLVERARAVDPALATEVEALAGEGHAAAHALDEARRLRSAFIANISHEIRTPITVMQGMIEVVLEDLRDRLPADLLDLLERIRLSGENLLELLQAILDLSKADAGVLETRPTRVYLPDLVADLVRKTEASLESKPVRLVVDVPREIEWITVDASRLRQILLCLLSNAAKFTAEGEIRLEARRVGAVPDAATDPATLLRAPTPAGDTLEIAVRDTGNGISTADQELIFEAFRQVDVSSTRRHEGLGIGLTIVREMAKLLGASVRLTSEPGAGTEFRVRLPLTTTETAARPAPARRRGSPPSRRRLPDPRGLLPELAGLMRAPADSNADATAFALDFLDRLLRPEIALFAERTGGRWTVVDALGHGSERPIPGDPAPFATEALESAEPLRTPVRDARAEWALAVVGKSGGRVLDVLAVRTPEVTDDDQDLRILQITARWLELELARQHLEGERNEIIAAIGRDVKHPLGSALGVTHALLRGLRGELSVEQRSAILHLERTIHRTILSSLDLLDYERVLGQSLVRTRQAFPLARVVDHVLSRHTAAVEVGDHSIRRELPPDLPACFGDEIRTDRSLSNVLRALLERAPRGSEIAFRGRAEAERVVCEITAAAEGASFLEPLSGERREPRLTETLGLRIARAGIEAQGGRVAVEARPGSLVIRVELPRAGTPGVS